MTFTDIFANNSRVLSFEFFPPRNPEDLEDTKSLIKRLSQLNPNFMTVTYGAGGGTRELTRELTSYIARVLGVTSVAHLTCIDHSAADIDTIVDELIANGIHHILALRGDPPRGANCFVAHPEGFACARDLVAHLKPRKDISLAVAGYPEPHPESQSPDADIEYLKEKIAAGAECVITQLFFEPELYFSFVERCPRAGISVPIVPGILPIRNIQQVKRFTELCGATIPAKIQTELTSLEATPDAVISYGVDLASSLCQKLIEGGAPGIHLYTLNKSTQIELVVKNIAGMVR